MAERNSTANRTSTKRPKSLNTVRSKRTRKPSELCVWDISVPDDNDCVRLFTTLDPELARRMEPRASAPRRRIETIKALSDAGIPVGVMTAPMIPALNDKEMETILETAVAAGAEWAGYGVLRLPLEIKDLFREWLEAHYPDKAKHVLNLIRDMRDGKLNNSEFGSRMRGNGAYAELLARRFTLAVKRLNLNRERFRLDKTQFAPPPRAGDQLSLL